MARAGPDTRTVGERLFGDGKEKKKSAVTAKARAAMLADRMHGAGKGDPTQKRPASMTTKGVGARLYGTG
jgi:hypothetical protein